ncbi:hypothetical protein CYMTET_28496 [Cymbomonas tetramitiformis]|uniref:Uncharacterized protein n=1 Tax=Cymbomonas tetramitiformis TaxID=36881 RepID=A0AAE0FMP4_9CHLO|nr:hypothetical protein CYMTET_28496 [Cymbomonas tetramitiformis]
MTSFPNVKALLDYTGKLGKLKLGSTASALTHQKAVLVEAKKFLGSVVRGPHGGPTATDAEGGRGTIPFVRGGGWRFSTKKETAGTAVPGTGQGEEVRGGMSPASSRKRAKAMSRVRRAYRAVMPILRAVEGVPHAFGDELEWNIRPEACPELAKLRVDEGDMATLDDLENARGVKSAAINDYVAFLRGSAVVWHAHLRKCPDVNLSGLADPRKETWVDAVQSVTKNLRFEDLTEAPTPSTTPNNDTLMKDANVMKAADKLFKGDYFAADVVPHATGAVGALNVALGPLRGLDLTLLQPVEASSEFRECFQA